jgi:hypothetical protein
MQQIQHVTKWAVQQPVLTDLLDGHYAIKTNTHGYLLTLLLFPFSVLLTNRAFPFLLKQKKTIELQQAARHPSALAGISVRFESLA